MITFNALVEKFASQGEKTGWTYIKIPEALAQQLLPNNKKAFRVKGTLDNYSFEAISLIPMGGGDFILALNGKIRKAIGKSKGAIVAVKMEVDTKPVELSKDLLECLADDPGALAYFKQIPGSHQKYYSNWVESAKTEATKAKRIAHAVSACSRQQQYGEMIRSLKTEQP